MRPGCAVDMTWVFLTYPSVLGQGVHAMCSLDLLLPYHETMAGSVLHDNLLSLKKHGTTCVPVPPNVTAM